MNFRFSTSMVSWNFYEPLNLNILLKIHRATFKRQGLKQESPSVYIGSCTLSHHYFGKMPSGKVRRSTRNTTCGGISHAAPLRLPELGPDRLPEGTRWGCQQPTSGEAPAPAALSLTAPLAAAPACSGGTVALRSQIYTYIFLSHHTAVSPSQRDCSHKAYRIASLDPTTYRALKADRKIKQNKGTKEHMILFKRSTLMIFSNFYYRKASLPSEKCLLCLTVFIIKHTYL